MEPETLSLGRRETESCSASTKMFNILSSVYWEGSDKPELD